MLPEDRKVEGLFPDLDVRENLVITRPRRYEGAVSRALLDRPAEQAEYERVSRVSRCGRTHPVSWSLRSAVATSRRYCWVGPW